MWWSREEWQGMFLSRPWSGQDRADSPVPGQEDRWKHHGEEENRFRCSAAGTLLPPGNRGKQGDGISVIERGIEPGQEMDVPAVLEDINQVTQDSRV